MENESNQDVIYDVEAQTMIPLEGDRYFMAFFP